MLLNNVQCPGQPPAPCTPHQSSSPQGSKGPERTMCASSILLGLPSLLSCLQANNEASPGFNRIRAAEANVKTKPNANVFLCKLRRGWRLPVEKVPLLGAKITPMFLLCSKMR